MRKVNWKLVFGVMCILGAMYAFEDGTDGALESLVTGVLLIAWWYLPSKNTPQRAAAVVSNDAAVPVQYVILMPDGTLVPVSAVSKEYVNMGSQSLK